MKQFAFAAVAALAFGIATQAADDKGLSVTAPPSVSVTQGKVQTFKVYIKRTGFTDPVKLTFTLKHAKGVKLVEKKTIIAKDKTFGTFTLEAASDALVTTKALGFVTAEAAGKKTEAAKFPIQVVEKK